MLNDYCYEFRSVNDRLRCNFNSKYLTWLVQIFNEVSIITEHFSLLYEMNKRGCTDWTWWATWRTRSSWARLGPTTRSSSWCTNSRNKWTSSAVRCCTLSCVHSWTSSRWRPTRSHASCTARWSSATTGSRANNSEYCSNEKALAVKCLNLFALHL